MLLILGSTYITTTADESLAPSVMFGGVWECIVDKFLFCSDNNFASGVLGGSPSHTHTLPSHSLTISQIPVHNHDVSINLDPVPGHIHTVPTADPNLATGEGLINQENMADPGTDNTPNSSDFNHTHNVSGKTDNTGASNVSSHTHLILEAENIPPYYSVICWVRIA